MPKFRICFSSLSLAAIPFLLSLCSTYASTLPTDRCTVLPDSKAIAYSGRVDAGDSSVAVMGYSGTRARLAFEGDWIGMRMDDLNPNNTVTVFIDGVRAEKISIDHADDLYLLATGLGSGTHTVEVVKATEGSVGNVGFKGFVLPEDGKVLPWPTTQTRSIEFIGDSITCGYGIEANDPKAHFKPSEENFSDTYAALTARALDADYLVVARSGIGMLRSYAGPRGGITEKNMPAVYERTLYKQPSPDWDFSRFTPDVVCINLGTNDFSGPGPDRAKFEKRYVQFVGRLMEQYPEAKIVVLQGPMNNAPELQAILKRVVSTCDDGNRRVSYFELSAQGNYGFGADYHPSQEQGKINGMELTAYLRGLMGWE